MTEKEGARPPLPAGLGKGRMESLTDGIFATVMTILVLTLSVPIVSGTQLAQSLDASLSNLLPDILSYVASFLILAVMWVSHHSVYHYIRSVNRQMLWFNILFLLTVGFVPFSTALLGKYPLEQVAVMIYGINIVAIALSMQGFLSYGLRSGLIIPEGPGSGIVSLIVGRWRLGVVIYSAAIAVSFVSTEVSVAIYVLALGFYVLSSGLGFKFPRK